MAVKKILTFGMILTTLFSSLLADTLEIGAAAPAVMAVGHSGEAIDLGKELSVGTVLIFFYPKALTPGCTKQACSLRDSWDELNALNLKIYGVSSDPAKTQASFAAKYELPFTLIADTDLAVCEAFGKNRFSRQAYIFKDGVLVWRDLRASTTNQAADVLAALKAL
jgi:peroxiredoxin Q/BCP